MRRDGDGWNVDNSSHGRQEQDSTAVDGHHAPYIPSSGFQFCVISYIATMPWTLPSELLYSRFGRRRLHGKIDAAWLR